MSTVLLTWELGGGMGHITNLRPIGQALALRGHRVVAAVRDLARVRGLFAGTGIGYLPAPVSLRPRKGPVDDPLSFAHILTNIGYTNEDALETVVSAWGTLIECVRPDLVIAEHSPTALLALRGLKIPRVTVGTGFTCPPDSFPLAHWPRNGEAADPGRLEEDEVRVLRCLNRALESRAHPPLARLGQLFNEVDEVILATYRELDHFGGRAGAQYWGHWPFGVGDRPAWPAGDGSKIFAYLKPFPAIEDLLRLLNAAGLPTIVMADNLDQTLLDRYASATLSFESRPVDLRAVAAECDLAILHAGHGATAAMLLAGKPCLLLPIHMEQLLLAKKVEQLGACRLAPLRSGPLIAEALQEMLGSAFYGKRARKFAEGYRGFTPGQQVAEVVDRIEQKLGLR
jgi:UDP:flavonoid glycosyltransferase YjiC (YdhE family)